MPRSRIHGNQFLVLKTIYGWRFEGRFLVAEGGVEIKKQTRLPVYLIEAELEGRSSADVLSLLDVLERKGLIEWREGHYHKSECWRLPDRRIIRSESYPAPSLPGLTIVGLRSRIWLDGQVFAEEGNCRCIDLTRAGIEVVEARRPRRAKQVKRSVQRRTSSVSGAAPAGSRELLRLRAEKHVKGRKGIFPGVRALAGKLRRAPSSLLDAIKDSSYLTARKAEYMALRKRPRVEPLDSVTLNGQAQATEPDPSKTLEGLIEDQQADQRADDRRSTRGGRSHRRS